MPVSVVVFVVVFSGLGFNIVGGVDQQFVVNDSGIYVSKIKEDGAAGLDGRLTEGDKILAINGTKLENLTHRDAVELFRTAGEDVELRVRKKGGRQTGRHRAGKQPHHTDGPRLLCYFIKRTTNTFIRRVVGGWWLEKESCRGGLYRLADQEDAGCGPAVEAAPAGDAAGELDSPLLLLLLLLLLLTSAVINHHGSGVLFHSCCSNILRVKMARTPPPSVRPSCRLFARDEEEDARFRFQPSQGPSSPLWIML
uniref:Synaptojanin-2-binding protein n=1 Tax=Dicentrarchus labrax TaxID=13489 RepID=A0A8P4KIT4_DICLA